MSEPWKWGDEGKPKPEYKEPTGRHLCCGMDAEMKPFAQGDWVPYNEHEVAQREKNETIARLQAQVDFYKKKLENETDYLVKIGLIDQVKHLKGREERLIKAGDDLANVVLFALQRMDGKEPALVKAWEDAKENK